MVREAVKGMETRSLADRARHQTILPFTRYLAGGADYTTMIFNQRRGDTTWANQIASLAIFDSPLLTIAANPQSILTNAAVDVIKSIPAVWDETIVLPDSEIGALAVYARRTGETWFIAVMCGPQPETINVPLSFLGDGQYQASFVRDGDNDGAITVENTTGKGTDSLTIKLRGGGGFVARFSRN
jgi:alpha-glucosidase